MIPNRENLIKMLEKSIDYVLENFADEIVDIDHASFQTTDNEEFNKLYDKLSKSESFKKEIHYSGRKLALFELKEPIKIDSTYFLKRIEIEEPKPGSDIKTSNWESVSFKVKNLDAVIEKYKNSDKELQKVRQVGDDKYGYVMLKDFRIQLRNNFFGIEGENGKTEEKKSEEMDFKKMFEEEKEKRLRALADIDNEKKRMERQKEEFIRLANIAIVKDLFDVVDDLNRATQGDLSVDSIKMIYNKMLGILNNYGVIPFEVKKGDNFEPNHMEAVTTVDSGEENKNKVIHIDQIGFKSKEDDRILRPSRVIVGK